MLIWFLACVPHSPYMTPPPELAGVADVWMPVDQGPLGLPAKVGEWTVKEASCEPSVVNSGTLETMEWMDRQDNCRVVLTDPGPVDWSIDCLRRVKSSGRRVGAEALFADSRTDELHCTVRQPNDRWELELSGGFTEGWKGTLRRNGANIRVAAAHTISGQTDPAARVTGVWFYENDQPRAAVDFLKAGVFWLDPALDRAKVGPVLGSGLAVLLYAGREYMEEGSTR